MKALKLNTVYKLLFLVILPLFIFFLSFPKSANAFVCGTQTCLTTHECAPTFGDCRHRGTAYCNVLNTCSYDWPADNTCPGCGGTTTTTTPPPGGGGGGDGGGGTPPSTGETPPHGIYLSCYKHGETCNASITTNGIQCCDKSDTCVPKVWVSLKGEWPGVCLNPTAIIDNSTCNGSWCDTAVGQISTGPWGFAKALFSVILGISGGIAIILIIISGYRLMTSRGNPEQVQVAKEQLTAAIVGLMFVIFSLVILQTIGVDILQLPGFRG
jgi:hypothetical protein